MEMKWPIRVEKHLGGRHGSSMMLSGGSFGTGKQISWKDTTLCDLGQVTQPL